MQFQILVHAESPKFYIFDCIWANSDKKNQLPTVIMQLAVPLPCYSDVIKSQRVAGQRPQEGTKSSRMGRKSVCPSVHPSVRPSIHPPPGLLAGPQAPLARPQAPKAGPQTPLTGLQTTLTDQQAPLAGHQTPLTGNQTPLIGPQAPMTGLQGPLAGPLAGPQALRLLWKVPAAPCETPHYRK